MTHKELKDKIIEKFGTMYRCSFLLGDPYPQKLNSFLNRPDHNITPEEQERINQLYERIKVLREPQKDLTDLEIASLKYAVLVLYDSETILTRELNWSKSGMNDLLNGRRRYKSDRTLELMHRLGAELGDSTRERPEFKTPGKIKRIDNAKAAIMEAHGVFPDQLDFEAVAVEALSNAREL
jgi:hypothetical protein